MLEGPVAASDTLPPVPHTTLVLVPQTTLLPCIVDVPHTTELPQTTEFALRMPVPQTTDVPHTTELPQTTDVPEMFCIEMLPSELRTARGESAEPVTESTFESAAGIFR